MPKRVSLTVFPVSQHGRKVLITVQDTGNVPVTVHTRTVILHSRCAMSLTGNVRVNPAVFDLVPKHSREVIVTVTGPNADYGVAFSGTTTGPHPISVADAVGSQVISGKSTSCVPVAHPKPTGIAYHLPHASAFPVTTAVIVAGLVVALIVILAVSYKRFRKTIP